jgi:hypothetical protein
MLACWVHGISLPFFARGSAFSEHRIGTRLIGTEVMISKTLTTLRKLRKESFKAFQKQQMAEQKRVVAPSSVKFDAEKAFSSTVQRFPAKPLRSVVPENTVNSMPKDRQGKIKLNPHRTEVIVSPTKDQTANDLGTKKEDAAPTNSMGASSSTHGTGSLDTYDPILSKKPKKRKCNP